MHGLISFVYLLIQIRKNMRSFIFCSLFLLSWQMFAQFPYGTALVPASVSVDIDETRESFCDGILSEKTISKESYSTKLNANIYWSELDIERMYLFPQVNGLPGTRVSFNNFTQTLPEGANFYDGKSFQIPQFPLSMSFDERHYGTDPCKAYIYGCDPDFKAVLNNTESCAGTASHHGHPGVTFSCAIVGMNKCSNYFFFSFFSGGTFVEDGTAEIPFITGEAAKLKAKTEKDGCTWEWEKYDAKQLAILELRQALDAGDENSGWVGKGGVYTKYEETDEGDGTMYKSRTEVDLPRIDTATFFNYIRKKPAIQTFKARGSYYSTETSGNKKEVTSIRYSITLTLGKKPGFSIEAENKEAYEKWLPGNQEYSESFSPLSFKASFEDLQQTDTIYFNLDKISHLPGICTNYPILGDKPPKEEPDIYFAPQDKQTDENIRILNDSEAVTMKKVNEAVIVVYSRDFGGHAILKSRSFFSSDVAVCPYDDDYSIEIPNDQNHNHIADVWEKDMGVDGIDKLDDKDKLPTGQNREGDGLTAFEEYRGFISEKDLIASCDADHTKRAGKHVRTSPLCRDIFIHDADGLFAKYVAAPNPAECHWHYLNKDQIKLPPADQVSTVVSINEPGYTGNMATGAGYVKNWIEKEYRRINKNTPDTLRNNKQFAMYLILSPLASTSGGNTIFYPSGETANASPLTYGHIVMLPQFESYKTLQMGVINYFKKNSKNDLAKSYPADVVNALLQTIYEAMVIHETGHGLGIEHHSKGLLTVIKTETNEKITINAGNNESYTEAQKYKEFFYLDKKEYLITNPSYAFLALGVNDCCMRYTAEREVDFIDKKVLMRTLKYCKKGQKFTNGDGSQTDADDCFGSIKIRCMN